MASLFSYSTVQVPPLVVSERMLCPSKNGKPWKEGTPKESVERNTGEAKMYGSLETYRTVQKGYLVGKLLILEHPFLYYNCLGNCENMPQC